jgi:metallo-beta-lactamase class B
MTVHENGRPYRVVFYCGTSIVQPLVDNDRYPGIAEDYERSFRIFRAMEGDVFFEGHPERFRMIEKRRRMKEGSPNPFVDPGELARFVENEERRFHAELARQRSARHPTHAPAR